MFPDIKTIRHSEASSSTIRRWYRTGTTAEPDWYLPTWVNTHKVRNAGNTWRMLGHVEERRHLVSGRDEKQTDMLARTADTHADQLWLLMSVFLPPEAELRMCMKGSGRERFYPRCHKDGLVASLPSATACFSTVSRLSSLIRILAFTLIQSNQPPPPPNTSVLVCGGLGVTLQQPLSAAPDPLYQSTLTANIRLHTDLSYGLAFGNDQWVNSECSKPKKLHFGRKWKWNLERLIWSRWGRYDHRKIKSVGNIKHCRRASGTLISSLCLKSTLMKQLIAQQSLCLPHEDTAYRRCAERPNNGEQGCRAQFPPEHQGSNWSGFGRNQDNSRQRGKRETRLLHKRSSRTHSSETENQAPFAPYVELMAGKQDVFQGQQQKRSMWCQNDAFTDQNKVQGPDDPRPQSQHWNYFLVQYYVC